ncbi:MAG: M28 family metallopeptidase [Pseudomonadota bacterium]
MRQLPVIALALLATHALAAAPVATPAFTPERMRAHVSFLADDLLEGRKTGTRGHEIAARYIAAQFESYGLKPGGSNGWYQRITFQQTERGAKRGALTLSSAAGDRTWAHGTDVLVGMNPNDLTLDVSAALVFVGYGIEDPRFKLDDYRGLDVKGKIAVALSGFPKGLPSEEGSHLAATKDEVAQRHGAIGLISIHTLQTMQTFPWKRYLEVAEDPYIDWVAEDGKVHEDAPAIRARATLNTPAAEALFVGAPRNLEALRREADQVGKSPRGFPLKLRARIQSEAVAHRLTSPNVIGILPGADPALANQYVVLSAHADHLGVEPARPADKPDTDRINNGALDNGAGVATMLEVARAAAGAADRPRRSIIFVASTGEEEGLLGADYFARHPPVPIAQIVGNVDLDMPVLLYPFTDVVAFGADHSTFGPLVAAAVAPMGIKLAPDPMAAQGFFTRSDHYMFVRQGVPAVFFATGFANGGEKAWASFLDDGYHRPNDDMQQKIDWDAGARFAEVNYRVTRAMADADEAPRWNKGDFFGDIFAPKAPRAPKP